MSNIDQSVQRIVSRILDKEEVENLCVRDLTLKELGANNLNVIEIIIALEDELGFAIDDPQINISCEMTVKEMVERINLKVPKQRINAR